MFTRYENGAEVEMEAVAYVKSGAEQEAEAAYRVKNGAEEEVWANTKLLDLVEKTTTTGSAKSPTKWGNKTTLTALNDSGYIRYAVDGSWYNPKIEFDYHGFFLYITTLGSVQINSAGKLYAYGKKADGTIELLNETQVNTYEAGSAQPFSFTFTGGYYTEVGFQIKWNNWSVSESYSPNYTAEISNILIDGQKYITDPADDYSY